MSIFSKDRIIANHDFNRWLIPPASIGIHLCIGSVYAWSIFNPALTKSLGVVVSSANDWSLSEVVWIFSVAIVSLGLAAAFAGKWLEEVGPRLVGFVAACLWGGGFLIGSIGVFTHQLWLIYIGYGVFGGFGLGLGYVSLGQSSNTLSGGEAQRIKLASFIGKGEQIEKTFFIFDEPTTGLHFNDIKKLLSTFEKLKVMGHSLLVIEHNLEMIKCADYISDLGPEGGNKGGEVVAKGTPEQIIKSKDSYTGKYLKNKI